MDLSNSIDLEKRIINLPSGVANEKNELEVKNLITKCFKEKYNKSIYIIWWYWKVDSIGHIRLMLLVKKVQNKNWSIRIS